MSLIVNNKCLFYSLFLGLQRYNILFYSTKICIDFLNIDFCVGHPVWCSTIRQDPRRSLPSGLCRGHTQHQAEIDAIINNPAPPDFENTIVAYDQAGALMSKYQPGIWWLAWCRNQSPLAGNCP
jgi:hypothetical protein